MPINWPINRAGRYKIDGSFDVTGGCENLQSDEIERIESHKLDEIKFLFWRNSDLNFSSAEDLIRSLEKKPSSRNFLKIADSLDENVLKYLVTVSYTHLTLPTKRIV